MVSKAVSRKAKTTVAVRKKRIDWLRVAAIMASVAGMFVAGYLTWAELNDTVTVCADVGRIDCGAVQTSPYASTYGLSTALLGLLGYLVILGVLVLEDQISFVAAYGRTAVVGFALFGTVFQTYLTLVEEFVLDAYCQWCVASAVLIVLLLVLGIFRLRSFLQPLQD